MPLLWAWYCLFQRLFCLFSHFEHLCSDIYSMLVMRWVTQHGLKESVENVKEVPGEWSPFVYDMYICKYMCVATDDLNGCLVVCRLRSPHSYLVTRVNSLALHTGGDDFTTRCVCSRYGLCGMCPSVSALVFCHDVCMDRAGFQHRGSLFCLRFI